MSHSETHILLFDGVCNLCNGFVKFTIKRDRDKKFKFASLQSETGQALLDKFNLSTKEFDSFIYISGDQYFIKSGAGLRVLRELGGIWKMFYFLIFVPRPLRDFIYNIIAGSRYRLFGKREECMIPTQKMKDRFLE